MISQETRLLAGIDGYSMTMPPGSTTFLPTVTFADATARGLLAPVQIDQIGVQHDTGAIYRGSSLAAGGWTLIPTSAGTTYTAGNGLTLTVTTFSINTAITADLSTVQALTNKSVNGVTLNAAGSASLFLNQAGSYTAPASSGVQTSDSPTWTGAHIWSKNGAASQPTMAITGTPFAGTANNSLPLIYNTFGGPAAVTTWNTAGTVWGGNYNSFSGMLVDWRANGSANSSWSVTAAGYMTLAQGMQIQGTLLNNNAGSGLQFVGRGSWLPSNDGALGLFTVAAAGCRLQASADKLTIRSGDGTVDGAFQAARITGTLPFILPLYTIGTLPAAASHARGVAYVSDGASNKFMVFSDGSIWRYPDGGAV